MAREILFKAKRIDNGEWVEGYYAIAIDKRGIRQHNILVADHSYGYFKWYVIDVNTLCQYTGLLDKNGNKIWENDICDRKEIYPEIVKYHEGDYVLDYSYAFGKEEGNCCCNLGFYCCERKCVKVIGNIFDNPELLGGTE